MEALFFFGFGLVSAFVLVFARHRFASFPAQSVADYEDGFPAFDMKEHLTGQMICEGAIFGPVGRITSTFIAHFDIDWQGNTCVMNETFEYNDGTSQHRVWTVTLGQNGTFTATAPDVPGQGMGTVSGQAVQLRYPIRLPEELGAHVLRTVDWMYLTPNGTIVNRSQFRKYGVKVAELVATIRPKETA